MDERRGQRFHLTLNVVPPPELVADGMKGDQYTREVARRYVGDSISRFVQSIVDDTRILQQRGSIVITVRLAESADSATVNEEKK